jgi:hypothetical protein
VRLECVEEVAIRLLRIAKVKAGIRAGSDGVDGHGILQVDSRACISRIYASSAIAIKPFPINGDKVKKSG